ncbi:proton-transporting V-type ATPase complex assembly regulator TMEM9-like isoform X1 [Ylistrum balloti]|uniref:proton-transporting V-type ATPase complex assembly regulator TMEM9-like isoform X1 n=1 Tax=Ylistrum balloti TaxID=509963 RepID=UPI002905F011|nr:proton-transporting V-type ATPase complex assembly regulator TMEM9-like isoform X1 [Ylistrum balloti]
MKIYALLIAICVVNSVFTEKVPTAQPTLQQTSFEDKRCKCVCPKLVSNVTKNEQSVYIKDILDPEDCKCKHVVTNATDELCVQCECKYEERNTTTIKVVVIFIICVVSLLFVYMLFLLCLDPLIARRPTQYQQQTNEEVNLDDHSVSQMSSRPEMTRQRSIINRVTDEQKKWKGTVQEQRKTIYDRHALLN